MYYTLSTLMIGAKRFEADEMAQFIFDLAHKEGISKIWKKYF